MSLSLDMASFQAVSLPDGKYFFVKELPDNTLLFQNQTTNASLALTERQLVTMLGYEGAYLIDPPVRTRGTDPDPDAFSPVIPPNISEQKLREAEIIQKYILLSDRSNPPPKRGTKYWQAFVAANRARVLGRGADPGVTSWQVEAGWKKVRHTGIRHQSVFISQRGLGPRNRLPRDEVKAYDVAVAHFYSTRGVTHAHAKITLEGEFLRANKEREKSGLALLRLPEGDTTLRTKVHKERSVANVARKTSKREADAEFNGTNPSLESQIPFEYVALDFTVLDVFVVDDRTGMLLGRPTLGTGIEISSRCIAGILLTFEDPSISTILSLIKQCILPKYFVEEMLPDVVDRINTFGKPYNIILDRGLENLSGGLRHSCSQIGTDVRWAPRKTGQGKTWVERLFGTLNSTAVHPLPGAIPYHSALMRKLDLNPAKTAVMTMSSLLNVLYRNWIIYENQTHEGIGEPPAVRLKRLLKVHKRPMLANMSALETLIGNTKTGTLGTDGINFCGMQFQNKTATTEIRGALISEQKRGDKNNSKTRVEITIKYNPDDASVIHVPFKKDGIYVYVPFFNRMPRFIFGLSFSLEKRIRRFAKDNNLAYEREEHRVQARLAYVALVEQLSKLRGAASREVDKKVLAVISRLRGELPLDQPDIDLDDENVKLITSPYDHSTETDVRAPGIRRGTAKAAATRKHNKKVRENIGRLRASLSDETPLPTESYNEPLGISFGTRGTQK